MATKIESEYVLAIPPQPTHSKASSSGLIALNAIGPDFSCSPLEPEDFAKFKVKWSEELASGAIIPFIDRDDPSLFWIYTENREAALMLMSDSHGRHDW